MFLILSYMESLSIRIVLIELRNYIRKILSKIFIAGLYMSVCYLCSLVGGIYPFMGSQMKPVSPATNDQIISQSEQNTLYLKHNSWPQLFTLLIDLLPNKVSQITIQHLIKFLTIVRKAYILPCPPVSNWLEHYSGPKQFQLAILIRIIKN